MYKSGLGLFHSVFFPFRLVLIFGILNRHRNLSKKKFTASIYDGRTIGVSRRKYRNLQHILTIRPSWSNVMPVLFAFGSGDYGPGHYVVHDNHEQPHGNSRGADNY